MNTIAFSYNPEEMVASCIIMYHGMEFVGFAQCHPEDEDFASERTGCTIAELRARLQMLRYMRDGEIKPTLTAFKHTMDCMKTSKHFNPASYEAKMIKNKIKQYERELIDIKNEISYSSDNLKTYIDGKDKVYKKLRQARSN